MMTGAPKYPERKCVGKIGWLQILTLEKCTVPLKECEYSVEIIIVCLKESITRANFFWK